VTPLGNFTRASSVEIEGTTTQSFAVLPVHRRGHLVVVGELEGIDSPRRISSNVRPVLGG